MAPNVVAPILHGIHGWGEFAIDGVHQGRQWRADVLLCPHHAPAMKRYIEAGGTPSAGRPPHIQSCRGGRQVEPTYLDPEPVAVGTTDKEAHDG